LIFAILINNGLYLNLQSLFSDQLLEGIGSIQTIYTVGSNNSILELKVHEILKLVGGGQDEDSCLGYAVVRQLVAFIDELILILFELGLHVVVQVADIDICPEANLILQRYD
jgi:hypothetical protein